MRERCSQLLRQIAADAVGQDRHLRANVHSRLEVRALGAMTPNAAVAGPHADDPFSIHQELGAGKAREHVDAFGFDEVRQPFAQLLKRNDVVAVIPQRWRREGKRDLAGRREEVDAIVVHFRREGRAFRLEVGHELRERSRIEHSARQQMRSRLRGLLEDGDAERLACRLLQLCKPQRRRQPRRPAADDQDIDVERFSLAHPRYFTAETHDAGNALSSKQSLILRLASCGETCDQAFSSSAIIAGTISNRSPTMP